MCRGRGGGGGGSRVDTANCVYWRVHHFHIVHPYVCSSAHLLSFYLSLQWGEESVCWGGGGGGGGMWRLDMWRNNT